MAGDPSKLTPGLCAKCGAPEVIWRCGVSWKTRKPQYRLACRACESDRVRRRTNKYEYTARWGEKNPDKRRAHGLVKRAVQAGKLTRQPCERCGDIRSEAHHEDYSKPLVVVWLCRLHHREHHREPIAASEAAA